MTWQLASFAVLALALLGGFAWYERSHPSSRVLALVGTLAALAVLGRIAFAAIPNVKPTTDIVLLAGYVFGGAPGFAVGAVSGLASNFFFTQGPWTPWQMAAWGAIGVFGALLARFFPDPARHGRLPLALACGLAGLGFGVVVNFGSVVTFGDEDLWRRYVAYQTVSLPWDVAHAVGNVAFFYLFGPALVRTLRRFRTRMEFSWPGRLANPTAPPAPATPTSARTATPPAALLVFATAVGLAALLAAAAAPPRAQASDAAPPRAQASDAAPPPAQASAAAPVGYLERAQNADGGFGAAPGQSSVDLYSGWVALGLAAQGRNPADVATRSGRSALDYVRAHARGLAGAKAPDEIGDLERTILVLTASGVNPRKVGGRDLLAPLTARFGSSGSIAQQVNLTAFGILALRGAGVAATDPRLKRAASWIARQQNPDGGFGFGMRGTGGDVDDTAAAIQALVAVGGQRAAVERATAYLRRNQNPDGGLPLIPGGTSNAQSTAWAIQGFVAAGVEPDRVRRAGSRSAYAYLESLVAPSGVVRFSRSSLQTPVWVTAYGALALSRQALPLRPARRGSRSAGAATERADPDPDAAAEDDAGGPSAAVLIPIVAALGLAGVAAVVVARR